MNKRNIMIAVAILIVGGLWYAFRPELLFVNQTVSEEFPGGAAMASIEKGPMAVTKGNFKGLALKPRVSHHCPAWCRVSPCTRSSRNWSASV